MKLLHLFFLSLVLVSCSSDEDVNLRDLNSIRRDFINTILSESFIDEAPLQMNYRLRTILFSDHVISLLGEIFVYAHLPHGWTKYESKTFIKEGNSFKQITLNDLFPLASQKEFLRAYCEDYLKYKDYQHNYFNAANPLSPHLELSSLKLFVVDHESMRIIFQPYTVGGTGDEPFTVKIPFDKLKKIWQQGNPLEKLLLPIKNKFVASWDSQNWVSEVSTDHSISS